MSEARPTPEARLEPVASEREELPTRGDTDEARSHGDSNEARSHGDSNKLPTHGERIADTLRDEILRGRYRVGERLASERDLACRFSVHRGAVREALKKLDQLGLAEIRPGGARVLALEDASLDVVVPLLSLDDPPDAEIVDAVLEVLSGLFAMAARLGVARADDAQRERASAIVDRLEAPDLDPDARHDALHELGDCFVEASGNLVLQLVRRGLRTDEIIGRLQRLRDRARDLAPQRPLDPALLARIRRDIVERDGDDAALAVQELTLELHRFAGETLCALRGME